VDERRHVHELDGDSGRERRGVVGRRREEGERGTQSLSSGRERARPDLGDEARVPGNRALELGLDLGEVLVEAGCRAHDLEGSHGLTPM